jgi:predicted nucleotidyltransferase
MIATERDIAWMVERITAVDTPDRIYLFGSQAKGTASPKSDIDLLIVGPSKEAPLRRDKQIVAALRGFPARFDLLCFTPDEITEELRDPVSFVSAALETARVIYERRR